MNTYDKMNQISKVRRIHSKYNICIRFHYSSKRLGYLSLVIFLAFVFKYLKKKKKIMNMTISNRTIFINNKRLIFLPFDYDQSKSTIIHELSWCKRNIVLHFVYIQVRFRDAAKIWLERIFLKILFWKIDAHNYF